MANTKKKRTARSAPKKRTALALVRRPKALEVLPAPLPPPVPERNLSDEIMLGGLGLVEVKLTEQEEAILSEPVDPAKLMWKPRKRGGPADIPYLPHTEYTRWFNRAFGRIGWALVPVGKPSMDAGKKCVVCPYVLYIHGQPAAFAMGEQEYFESNEQQTYGDALESTIASALRRCAKRLGVGLELWDKGYVEQLKRRGGPERRPSSDAPHDRPATVPAEQRSSNAADNEVITLAQRQRLAMTIQHTDRSDVEVQDWLRTVYGLTDVKPTRQIKRRDYDAIIKAIEAPGALPAGKG